ncbi:MAG: 16S rRNA (cytosine(1402)-N(4))-methyltransferase [Candidatus Melainabacteria bacterium]|nr:MAG: 16S rRNA (cytosine(1402)-N(4))-methyltransferase [Candidatus Melainabacteria bacterium]
MLDSAVALLNVRPGLTYVDATAGGGSHLKKILDKQKGSGLAIGVDKDTGAIEKLKTRLKGEKVELVQADFAELKEILPRFGVSTITGGILADLGVSSMQVDDPARGFSFNKDGPLDMRMNDRQELSAAQLVNQLPQDELANLIFEYGEEKNSRAIARAIVAARPLNRTSELAEIVCRAAKGRGIRQSKRSSRTGKVNAIHPATRTFQALRIAVNSELESLELLLEQSRSLLAPGARLVVITFHSLEDRLVKQFFRRMASHCVCPPRQPVCTCDKKPEFLIITRKPLVAEEKEVLANVRSRSAKLRAGEKLP